MQLHYINSSTSKDVTLEATLQIAAAQGNVNKMIGNERLMDAVAQAVQMMPVGNVWGQQAIGLRAVGALPNTIKGSFTNIIHTTNPNVPRYYNSNVLHLYYVQPIKKFFGFKEWFGHFALGVPVKGNTKVHYYPAKGDYQFENKNLDFSHENPISEANTIEDYLDSNREVYRYSIKLDDNKLFRAILGEVQADPSAKQLPGDPLTCVQAVHDIINAAYISTYIADADWADPEEMLTAHNEYLSAFPILRHAQNFPREFYLAYRREPNLFGIINGAWDFENLERDGIFEVIVFDR